MNKEQALTQLIQQLRNNSAQASNIYTRYTKLVDNHSADIDFQDNYGIAIDNVFENWTAPSQKALTVADKLVKKAQKTSLDDVDKYELTNEGHEYYYWRKYPEGSTAHDGAEEFRNMTGVQRIKAGRKSLQIKARNLRNNVKRIKKQCSDYFLIQPCYNTSPADVKLQRPLTYEDINFTINNALNREIMKRLDKVIKKHPDKDLLLTAREAQAVIEHRYQRIMVYLNWNNACGNYYWDDSHLGKRVLYPAGTKKSDVKSAMNAYQLMNYLLFTDNHTSLNSRVHLHTLAKPTIYKYDIRNAKKAIQKGQF